MIADGLLLCSSQRQTSCSLLLLVHQLQLTAHSQQHLHENHWLFYNLLHEIVHAARPAVVAAQVAVAAAAHVVHSSTVTVTEVTAQTIHARLYPAL